MTRSSSHSGAEWPSVLRFLIIQPPSTVALTNVASTCAGNYLLVSVALRMTRGHVKRTIIAASFRRSMGWEERVVVRSRLAPFRPRFWSLNPAIVRS